MTNILARIKSLGYGKYMALPLRHTLRPEYRRHYSPPTYLPTYLPQGCSCHGHFLHGIPPQHHLPLFKQTESTKQPHCAIQITGSHA